jgi:putative ABC transport system permease protein
MRKLLRRLDYLFGQRRIEADLREEMEFHRSEAQRRLEESGVPSHDAEVLARRTLGNTTLAREDARAASIAPCVDSLRQDVAYAFRVLRRAPGFATAMISVMALGIGTTTGVVGLIDSLVLRSLPVHEPDRLVYFSRPSFSYPVLMEVRARSTNVFSSIAAWNMDRLHVAWNKELEPTEVLMASGNFYSTLGIGAAIGRTFGEDDDRIGGSRHGLVAVISHAAWQRRFNSDPAVLGRPIRIEQNTFTIIGVTPPGFFGVAPGLAPEVTVPLTSRASPDQLRSASSDWVHLLGRLREDISLSAANVALRTFWPAVLEATTNPGMPADRRPRYLGRATSLEPGYAGYSRVRNQFAEPLWFLLGLVGLLLTVACASAANLLLARSVSRQREIAVRLAIGASRRRLMRQLLTESLVWTILASGVGLVLAVWSAGMLVALMTTSQEQILLDVSLNWRILLFSIALAFVTACACSVIPAVRATKLDPGTSLKETGQIGRSLLPWWSLGKSLVSAQVALTVLLLFGALLFVRSLSRVLAQDAGLDRQSVLVLATDPAAAGYEDQRVAAFYEQLRDRLSHIPGVQSASLSMYPPISDEDGAWTQDIAIDDNPVPDAPGRSSVYFNAISPGFFRTIGLQLVRGRDFSAEDTASAPRVIIINESLARRYFPSQDPIKRHITMGRNRNRQVLQIVGVVRNAKYQRLEEETRSIAYVPHTQHPRENLFAEMRIAGSFSTIADDIRRQVRALDPVVPVRLETITDRIRESLVTRRVIALLATALGATALALACAGVYGVLAYAVSRKRRELGLRLALGAERSRVLRMVMTESIVLAAIGIVAGVGGALFLGRYAQNLLYQVSPRDPLSLILGATIMLLVACLAGFLPARRASRVDPIVALRCE